LASATGFASMDFSATRLTAGLLGVSVVTSRVGLDPRESLPALFVSESRDGDISS
jgi:hypothetical protein